MNFGRLTPRGIAISSKAALAVALLLLALAATAAVAATAAAAEAGARTGAGSAATRAHLHAFRPPARLVAERQVLARVTSNDAGLLLALRFSQRVPRYRFQYLSGGRWITAVQRSATAGRRQVTVAVGFVRLRPGTAYRYRVQLLQSGRWHEASVRQFTTPASTSSIDSRTLYPTYWGAQVGPQFTGTQAPWDMNALTDFGNLVGKAPSLVPLNIPFEQCTDASNSSCFMYQFPVAQMNAMDNYGAIPMLNWGSQSIPLSGANDPGFTLNDVISGTYDAYIAQFAQAVKAWGHPFFLRFDWEMNGNWFPWSESANGNQPGQFVAAWRHVHDIFTSVGATNASWVWCPYVDPAHSLTDLSELYPGEGYVDWTCLDGYNFGTQTGHSWTSFGSLFDPSYASVSQLAPAKPTMIGEVGSSDVGGSKASWITDMFTQLPLLPRVRALVYFDTIDGQYDWPIETSASNVLAFSRGVSGANFIAATPSATR